MSIVCLPCSCKTMSHPAGVLSARCPPASPAAAAAAAAAAATAVAVAVVVAAAAAIECY